MTKHTYDARIERAVGQMMHVEDQGGAVAHVHSGSGETYAVDLQEARCTCEDHVNTGGWCKHLFRAAFEMGRTPAGDITPDHDTTDTPEVRADGGECAECATLSGLSCFDCYEGPAQ